MKKPIHGDELTIRYQGATVMARCGEITEMPGSEAGAAKFTFISKVPFHHGGQAVLVKGGSELAVRVERVTSIPQRHVNIVSLYGIFDDVATLPPSPMAAKVA